jgi:peroxiredoxin
MLVPREKVPSLSVPTLTHGTYNLATEHPERFSLVVFYRGLHCPICTRYLLELGKLQPEYTKRGVTVIALSSDTKERAAEMAKKVGSADLRFGYGLALAKAREWGLYISTSRGMTSIGIEEPARFSEPGVFLVKPDGTLFYGAVQTMPFARPHFDELLGAIDFVIAKDYPARGEYTGAV